MKNKKASTIKFSPFHHPARTNLLLGRAITEYIRKYPDYSDSDDLKVIGKTLFPVGYRFAEAEWKFYTKTNKKKKAVKK